MRQITPPHHCWFPSGERTKPADATERGQAPVRAVNTRKRMAVSCRCRRAMAPTTDASGSWVEIIRDLGDGWPLQAVVLAACKGRNDDRPGCYAAWWPAPLIGCQSCTFHATADERPDQPSGLSSPNTKGLPPQFALTVPLPNPHTKFLIQNHRSEFPIQMPFLLQHFRLSGSS
jgi:hypothetical protein